MFTLAKGRKIAPFNLIHEKKLDAMFVHVPDLLEFKKDHVIDLEAQRLANLAKHLPTNTIYKDKRGREFGCKWLSLTFSVPAIRLGSSKYDGSLQDHKNLRQTRRPEIR